MSRYIERDALSEVFTKFARRANNHDFEPTPTWNDAISIFHSMPIADVVEVVHGEWIDKGDSNYYYCSECDFPISKNYRIDVLHFCPHCGAKMEVSE